MTFLNLMNNVLRRLREEEVSSVTESTFAKMTGDFINDAKHIVEESNDWSALRSTISISTTASDNTYSLTGVGNNVKVMSVINDTQNCFMEYQSKDWFNDALYISSAVEGAPKYFTTMALTQAEILRFLSGQHLMAFTTCDLMSLNDRQPCHLIATLC